MILVLLGTQNNDFSRLLSEIDSYVEEGIITDNVIAQAGYTKYVSNNIKIFDFVPKDEMDALIDSATLIITHGGVGSIMKGIKLNKKVIAVPRLAKFNEHVNDHQVQIVENFDSLGYIKGVFDLNNLREILKNIDEFTPVFFENKEAKIPEIISNFIDNN